MEGFLAGRSVKFWAWTASIGVHLIVLTVFGVVKFSQQTVQARQHVIPLAKVSRIKELMQTTDVTAKPKVKKPLPKANSSSFATRPKRILPANRIFETPMAGPQTSACDWQKFSKLSAPQDTFSSARSGILLSGVEFFGSRTDQRKVCYLVDCSGSMQGIFGKVREKLKESIINLQPDQYFCIIFFGADRLFEFGNGRLLRATRQAKSTACDFIDSARPSGQTNALVAMERAVKVRDENGHSASVIYFLTDGFELTTKDAPRFSQKMINLLKRFAPTTRINTIGFWPQNQDRRMLEKIARQSGGEFVCITDGYNN